MSHLLHRLPLFLLSFFWTKAFVVGAFTADTRSSRNHPERSLCNVVNGGSSRRFAGRSSRPRYDPDESGGAGMEREKERKQTAFAGESQSTDRPTETIPAEPDPEIIPSKPKIVVLGATGLVGRRVVQQLLESSELQSATIVAFCRDYDKACRVLYDDLVVANSQKKGPKLQIVHGEILSSEDIFSENSKSEEDAVDEIEWLQRAQSAAKFYGASVSDYDDGMTQTQKETDDLWSSDALKEAISGCTAIISCVGNVRPTNPWTDFIKRPIVRLFRKDVSGWCPDTRHPYYANYLSTRKLLDYAEEEQAKRQAAVADREDGSEEEEEDKLDPPRIRFVRISDLCVTQQPWNFVPLLTNVFHSMAFRYHDMAEKALEESRLLDTVVIRPGDLVEDERPDGVSLQVDSAESIPHPSIVGREDVAALAVASTLLPAHHFARPSKQRPKSTLSNDLRLRRIGKSPLLAPSTSPPYHCTLGLRWTGDAIAMQPFPAQGLASDGHEEAKQGLRKALKEDRRKRDDGTIVMLKQDDAKRKNLQPLLKERKLKPYGVFVAIPVYLMMAVFVTTLLRNASLLVGGNYVDRLSQIIPSGVATRFSASSAFLWTWLTRVVGRVAPWMLGWKYRAISGAKYITI
uniref:NAD(P)-binding domain-containing protein n=1 Tax=Entomoneis paludosa TaxID=265537 RepID=A0A6U3A8A9_9STRA|mmetsp:Transcript_22665/g.47279  ORF Transcript_22665/g.47279 Transcript_22665/m.47279 type:complete len:631 (+) Transcript_22665:179-2071(+)|eukprot:CAMPEP_0172442380 /NCGR_PEP_ID=MMETSP1065-20121228/2825_1 /TAXON_ID=265537 /ORGANISM="Amphiprora paludosa, Strain CCMP125" /LENGTH=630 /DNA_ID=CAMNT_0013192219 /DNA_START=103 /DNA_END=1995 /DNA_ORIENTATION=+